MALPPAFDPDTGSLNAIIESPKGTRNKYKYEPKFERFVLSTVLPAGAVFPYDFGFIPGTRGEDGDPLDLLVLMDEPAFAGCVVPSRLIGVIEAEQTEESGTQRNDLLIAVACDSRDHSSVRSLDDLEPGLVEQIEHFWVSYNQARGREFKVQGRGGPCIARSTVEPGHQEATGSERPLKAVAANGRK